MTFNTLAAEIVADYWAARVPLVADRRLTRCTARVVSSLAEERVAHFMLRECSGIDHIYVDCQLRPHLEAGGGMRKPDLVVMSGGEIRLLIDVKMDMGYMRQGRLVPIAQNAADLLKSQGRDVTVAGHRKRMGDRCKYVVLILSGLNIDGNLRDAELRNANKLHPDVAARVLWPAHHPNDRHYVTQAELVKQLVCHAAPGVVEDLIELCATPSWRQSRLDERAFGQRLRQD